MTDEKARINNSKKNRFIIAGILFSIVGVIILAGAFVLGYAQLIKMSQQTDTLQKEVEQTQQLSRDFPQQLQQLREDLDKQTQGMADLRQMQGQHPDQWRISEAHYLVKLANDQLRFMQDIPLAMKLLQAANDEVKNATGSDINNIRKAISSDLAHLQSAQSVNIEDVFLRLIGLNEKVDQLPLLFQKMNADRKQSDLTQQDLSQLPWWKKGLQQTWNTLQKIVVVQHDRELPLLTTEQYQFLNQNLHAKIEAAIWGLLHHQPVVYQNSLSQMSRWIKRYFTPDAPLTESVLSSLDELQKVNIQGQTLTVDGSLQAFQDYLQSQSKRGG